MIMDGYISAKGKELGIPTPVNVKGVVYYGN